MYEEGKEVQKKQKVEANCLSVTTGAVRFAAFEESFGEFYRSHEGLRQSYQIVQNRLYILVDRE